MALQTITQSMPNQSDVIKNCNSNQNIMIQKLSKNISNQIDCNKLLINKQRKQLNMLNNKMSYMSDTNKHIDKNEQKIYDQINILKQNSDKYMKEIEQSSFSTSIAINSLGNKFISLQNNLYTNKTNSFKNDNNVTNSNIDDKDSLPFIVISSEDTITHDLDLTKRQITNLSSTMKLSSNGIRSTTEKELTITQKIIMTNINKINNNIGKMCKSTSLNNERADMNLENINKNIIKMANASHKNVSDSMSIDNKVKLKAQSAVKVTNFKNNL